MRKIFKLLLFSVLIISAAALTFAYRPVQFGGGSYYFVIVSGSMSPVLEPADWVVCLKTSFDEVAVGDIVAVQSPKNPKHIIVHRVVEIGEGYLLTKGDCCDLPDDFNTTSDMLLAKYTGFKIPKLGYLLAFSRTFVGFLVIYLIPCTLVIAVHTRKLLKLRNKKTMVWVTGYGVLSTKRFISTKRYSIKCRKRVNEMNAKIEEKLLEEYRNINRGKVVKPFTWVCERCGRKLAHTTPMNQITADGKNLIVCWDCKVEAYKAGETEAL